MTLQQSFTALHVRLASTCLGLASVVLISCSAELSPTAEQDTNTQVMENCPFDVNCALQDSASMGTFNRDGIARARQNTIQFQGSPSTASGAFIWIANRPMALATHHQFSFDLGSDGRGRYFANQAFRFDYTTSSCNGNVPQTPLAGQGAHVIATSLDADFTLLDLTPKQASANPFAARDGIPLELDPANRPSPGHDLYSIHHMAGLPQQWWAGKVLTIGESLGAVVMESNTWSGDIGGFASGAPVLNAFGHLVGTHARSISHDTCERTSGDPSWQTDFYAEVYPTICPLLTPAQGCADTHEPPYILPRTPGVYNYVTLDSHANPNACWNAPGWVRTVQQEEHVDSSEEAQALCSEAEGSVWLGRYRYSFDLYDASGFKLNYHTGLAHYYAPDVTLLLEFHEPFLQLPSGCWMQEKFPGNTGMTVYCDLPLKRGLNKATLTVTDATGQKSERTSFICAKGEPFTPSC